MIQDDFYLVFRNGSEIRAIPKSEDISPDSSQNKEEKKMQFKVGDIVTNNHLLPVYSPGQIKGKVLDTFTNGFILLEFPVGSEYHHKIFHEGYFDLVNRKESKVRFETIEAERYESHGKHKGKTIPVVITRVYDDVLGNSGMASCDKVNYDERQGILEATANMVYGGNFDREYQKEKARKKKIHDALSKCVICGKQFTTPEEARECEKAHVERKKAKHERYLVRKEAKKRIADAEREGEIERIMKEIYAKERQNAKTGQVR